MTSLTDECNICLNELGIHNKCITPCGHSFCFHCIMKSMAYKQTCPCCRAILIENNPLSISVNVHNIINDDETYHDIIVHDVTLYSGGYQGTTKLVKVAYTDPDTNSTTTFDNFILHGDGKFIYDDGTIYDGEFVDGQKCGFGKLTYASSFYEGFWANDMRNGNGKEYCYLTGHEYEGNWINDSKHGYGVLCKINDDRYEGNFKNDLFNGFGRMYESDGWYEGEWLNGSYSGFGRYERYVDYIYEGEWLWNGDKSVYHGAGKISFPDGECYEGNFDDGVYHGYGKLTYSDGSIYEGNFVDAARTGNGRMTYIDGSFDDGAWLFGKFVGGNILVDLTME